jgi:hypothetical protein
MSTSTNTNTVSKVYSFASNKLNSAVKGIIWNILDERPHKAYLNRTHEVAIVRRQLLQILAITAGICQQAIAITNIATNTYVAAVSLNNPVKTIQRSKQPIGWSKLIDTQSPPDPLPQRMSKWNPFPSPHPKPPHSHGKKLSNNSPTKQTRKIFHPLVPLQPITLPIGTHHL